MNKGFDKFIKNNFREYKILDNFLFFYFSIFPTKNCEEKTTNLSIIFFPIPFHPLTFLSFLPNWSWRWMCSGIFDMFIWYIHYDITSCVLGQFLLFWCNKIFYYLSKKKKKISLPDLFFFFDKYPLCSGTDNGNKFGSSRMIWLWKSHLHLEKVMSSTLQLPSLVILLCCLNIESDPYLSNLRWICHSYVVLLYLNVSFSCNLLFDWGSSFLGVPLNIDGPNM